MLTKAKKSLLVSLSALLCVMLLAFGLSATSIFARKTAKADGETKYVAQIGDVKYVSLQDALDNGKNKTVKLIADVIENVTIGQYKTTLDLNGFTINGGTVAGKPTLTITNNATIIDSSEGKTGTVKREDTAENSGKGSHYVIDIKDGTTIIEGGNFVNNSGNEGATSGASLIRIGDDSYKKYPQLTIKGGTFTQNNFIVIKVDRGTLFVTGGTLNSENSYAVESWGTSAVIKGGVINGDVTAWTYAGGNNSKLDISGGTINGDVKAINYKKATDKKSEISITGGYIGGTLGTYVYDGDYTETKDSIATISVTGGTFDKDPSNYLTESAKLTSDGGKFTVEKSYLAKVGETQYYTIEEAFKAQTASGEEIVLLRDYTTVSGFNSGSINRTVNLNGYTWTYNGTDNSDAAFEVNYPNVSLTVKDGNVVSSTMIGLIPSASAMTGTITYDNSSLVFENVKMTANGHSGFETNGLNENDNITLSGCELYVSNGYGIYFPSSGTLTIANTKIKTKTTGVQVCAGSLYISGTTAITVTGESVSKVENDGAIEDGAAVSIVDRTGYKGLDEIKITDGTFISTKGEAVKAYKWENKTETEFDNTKKIIAISGGKFSNKIPLDYCAQYYRPAKNTDGTYTSKYRIVAATQVELGEDIAFKYYIDSDSAKYNGTVTKVVVSYSGKEGGIVSKELSVKKDSSGSYYLFDGITPQMIDRSFSVTAVYDGFEVEDIDDDSVLKYLRTCLSSEKNRAIYSGIIANLANYCRAAAAYVGYDDTVNAIDSFMKVYSLSDYVKTGDFAESDCVADNSGEKIVNVAVKFDCQNKILVGIADDKFSENYIVKVNGNTITEWDTTISEGYRVYDVGGVNAVYIADSAKYITIEVFEKGNEKEAVQTVKYNVAGYCKAIYGGDNEKLKPLAQATYYYGLAAKEYVNQSAKA